MTSPCSPHTHPITFTHSSSASRRASRRLQLFRGPPARTRVTPLVLVKYAESEGDVSRVGAQRDRPRLRQRRSRDMRIKAYIPTIYLSPPLRHQSGEAH